MPLLNTASKVYMGSTLANAVYRGTAKVWPPASQAILGMEQGNGTQNANVDFSFPITLIGDVYLFVYRNQALGTPTPTDLVQVTAADAGSGRMSMWEVSGPAPKLKATGVNALISWVAVKVSKGTHVGAGIEYQASNTTPAVTAPVGGGAAPALVCYAANNYAVWTTPAGGQEVYRDTHAEARTSVNVVYFPTGPPPNGDRGLSGSNRIESSGAVWW